MPWFLVDDSAHSHPKIMKATNAAVGLWMRCGSYVAQHLTDGVVPGPVAEMYGTAPQIRKLLKVGLWHEHGHACPECPQPPTGDYYMHEYHKSNNPSRVEVEQRRAREAAKKRDYRARAGRGSKGRSPQKPSLFDDDPGANQDGTEDVSHAKRPPTSEEFAGHDAVSPGDSRGTSRAGVPIHSNPLPTRGAEEREQGAGSSGRAHEPALSLISADWQPTDEDVAAAQLARVDAGREQLTQQQLAAVTRKFVRRMTSDGRTAAEWGGRWQEWAERERIEPGGVVVPFAAGGAQQTKGQQQRAGLARLFDRTGEV